MAVTNEPSTVEPISSLSGPVPVEVVVSRLASARAAVGTCVGNDEGSPLSKVHVQTTTFFQQKEHVQTKYIYV